MVRGVPTARMRFKKRDLEEHKIVVEGKLREKKTPGLLCIFGTLTSLF